MRERMQITRVSMGKVLLSLALLSASLGSAVVRAEPEPCHVTLVGAAESAQATDGSIGVSDSQGNSSGPVPDANGGVRVDTVPGVTVFPMGRAAYLFRIIAGSDDA